MSPRVARHGEANEPGLTYWWFRMGLCIYIEDQPNSRTTEFIIRARFVEVTNLLAQIFHALSSRQNLQDACFSSALVGY